MGTISKQVDIAEDLTTFSINGKVEREQYAEMISDFYQNGPVTRNVLLDLTRCELDHIESSDVLSIARVPRPFLGVREGGKTAIVAPTDLAFGLARMYEFTSGEEGLPFDTSTFRTKEEALQWLRE